MIPAGINAVAFPFFSPLGVVLTAGIMLIIAGIAQSVSAVSFQKAGVFIPTVVVAHVFVPEGVMKTASHLQMRLLAGSGWLLFNGIVSVVFGETLWAQLPSSGPSAHLQGSAS
jgi:uncharacterized membrane protein HdeD (DUF308 family)